jgi:hypothetical protein
MRGVCMEPKQLYALIGGLRLRKKLEVCVFVVRIVAARLQQNALQFGEKCDRTMGRQPHGECDSLHVVWWLRRCTSTRESATALATAGRSSPKVGETSDEGASELQSH